MKEQLVNETLQAHIMELRRRLLICAVTIAIFSVLLFATAGDWLMGVLTAPVKSRGIQFIYVGLAEALSAQMKVVFIAAVILAAPVLFWELWEFIKPALYPEEKAPALKLSIVALGLFVIGVVFGYGVVFLAAISFFVVTGQDFATPMLSIRHYVNFMLGFVVPFGVAFELPVVMYALAKLNLVTAELLSSARRYIILIIFIVAAILTPPDVLSQLLMALPLLVLYEISVLVVRHTEKVQVINSCDLQKLE
jgi:sec-independent protein translocase protein TatC